MKKLLVYMILVVPGYLLAESSLLIAPSSQDMSLELLSAIFPAMGFGGTVLIGNLMTLLNMGMSGFVTFTIGYTAMYATLGSSIDSMQIGHKIRLWSIARIVIGIYLLLPMYRGFSTLQYFILWCVFNGVGLADVIWTKVAVLLETPSATYSANAAYWTDLRTTVGVSNAGNTMASALVNAELCMQYNYYNTVQKNPEVAGSYIVRSSYNDPSSTSPSYNGCGGNYSNAICYGSSSAPTQCGVFELLPNLNGSYATLVNALLQASSIVAQGVDAIYYNMYLGTQSQLLDSPGVIPTEMLVGCDTSSMSTPTNCPFAVSVVSAASNYLQSIALLRAPLPTPSGMATQMQQQGWAVAGYLYAYILSNASTAATTGQSGTALAPLSQYVFTGTGAKATVNTASPQAQDYVYNYLYAQMNTPQSNTLNQIATLQTTMQQSQSSVMSSAQSGQTICGSSGSASSYNMVCNPTVNSATAYMLSIIYNNLNNNNDTQGLQTGLNGLASFLVEMGGGSSQAGSITLINLVNTARCAVQSMTGIQIFAGGCEMTTNPNFFSSKTGSSCGSLIGPGGACNTSNTLNTCLETAIANNCITSGQGMFGSFYYNQTQNGSINPLLTVSNVGVQLMNAGLNSMYNNAQESLNMVIQAGIGNMVFTSILKLTAALGSAGFQMFSQPKLGMAFGYVIQAPLVLTDMAYQLLMFQLKFMMEAFMLLNAMIIGFGGVYAIYLPAIPMIIYTLGVIGWYAVVIESMIAAPLIAAGITYPEGGQFLGTAEQALQLGLAVLLRPSLMVIGLYMATIVAQVSIDILHYGMMFFIAYFLVNVTSVSSNLTGIVIVAMLSMVYVYVAFEILSQSYMMIATLPEHVMKWFIEGSSDSSSSSIANQLSYIKDQVQSTGEQIGRAQPSPGRLDLQADRVTNAVAKSILESVEELAKKSSKNTKVQMASSDSDDQDPDGTGPSRVPDGGRISESGEVRPIVNRISGSVVDPNDTTRNELYERPGEDGE